MSYRIEQTTVETFSLADEALCLTPDGWIPEASQIQIQGATSMDAAMETIWGDQKGLLGFGEMVFYQIEEFKGFLVFHPSDDDPEEA